MKHLRPLFFLFALVAASGSAWSATATTTFTVSAGVAPTCSIVANPLNFGTAIPTPINSNVDVTAVIGATCSAGAAYTIALSQGTGAGATLTSRRMSSGANAMQYGLYSDAGRTSIWGNGTGGTAIVNGTGTGAQQAHTVYGRIPAGQTAPIGTYTDTITVTITF